MLVIILSQGPGNYSTKRLKKAAESRGHNVTIHNPTEGLSIDNENTYDGVVIPRIAGSAVRKGIQSLTGFISSGCKSINDPYGVYVSHDKVLTLLIAKMNGVRIPYTMTSNYWLWNKFTPAPCIIKINSGSQGKGVTRIKDKEDVLPQTQLLDSLNADYMIQEVIEESAGMDIRVIVVGKRVVAAMKRINRKDFRSNVHQGGETEPVKLRPEERKAALTMAQALNLGVCGVDLMRTSNGPVLLEVNSSPGLVGIEHCVGTDIALAIIRKAERLQS